MTREEFALCFEETQYGDDFEACINAPRWLCPPDEPDDDGWTDVWFKAYDNATDSESNENTMEALARGFKFDCCVTLRRNYENYVQKNGVKDIVLVDHAHVRTHDDVLDFFWNYYNQLYREEQ